ncbi:MAG: PAS domain S-box protein [Candidatus Cloacimonetes bacterium]|nr:PAS domain S-box protein [Candidatus Cloacimonadota bacterium]
MNGKNMNKEQLLKELHDLRKQNAELQKKTIHQDRQNVSEQKAIRKCNERLMQIIHGSSVPTFVIDKDHKITYWNKACEKLTGIKAEMVFGTKKHWSAFYSAERPLMADIIVDSIPEDEIAMYYKDGYRKSKLIEAAYESEDFFADMGKNGRWLFFTAAPLKDSKGNVVGAIETLQDITGQKLAEEELKKHQKHLEDLVKERTIELHESEMKYRAIVEKSHDAIYIYYDENFLFVNDRTCEKSGYRKEELYKMNLWVLLHPDDKKRIMRIGIDRAKGINVPSTYEARIVRKDGKIRDCEFAVTAISYEGKYAALGIVRDITDRKKAEDEIKEYQLHLKIINNILRHDITNIFAVIKSALHLFRNNEDEKMLLEAEHNVRKGVAVIERMRKLEKFLSTHKTLNIYDLNPFLTSIKNNYLPLQITVDGKAKVFADEALESVFDNLIRNAIIHGKADMVKITIEKKNEDCIIKVADNGNGIPDNIKGKIFEESFKYGVQAHTGLGLYIVQKIVERYDGNIKVENNKPKGTVFIINLKLVK